MSDSDPTLGVEPSETISKEVPVTTTSTDVPSAPVASEKHVVPPRPAGWRYRGFKVFGRELWYASPKVQLFMVSMVCFLCPGMFNALTGLGGAGLNDPVASDHANTALYCTFSIVAFFSGTFANVLGLQLTLMVGGLGYCIYVASFLSYAHTANMGFAIFAGAFLGFCAGLLWTAQGAIMISYPPEESKGRYISWFWMIFNFGAVIGSLITLAQNIHNDGNQVTDGTYAGFLVLTIVGALLALGLCGAHHVIREDGSRVVLKKNPSWISEFVGLWETISSDWWIILLFPAFFASNVFYPYQNNDFNLGYFNLRTRSLNGLLYWLAQIIGSLIVGYALDYKGVRRSVRAKASLAMLFVVTFVVWGGGWAWQKDKPDRDVVELDSYEGQKIDWTDGSTFIAPMFLYMFYGAYDAVWQTCIYWYIGALSNSGRKAANMTGFYKGLQSAGAGVWWRLDGTKRSYRTMFTVTWSILAAGLVIAAPVIIMRIKDTTVLEDDLQGTGETKDDVLPGEAASEKSDEKSAA